MKDPNEQLPAPGSAEDFERLRQTTTRDKLAEERAAKYNRAADAISNFARAHDLTVVQDLTGRRIVLRGTLAQTERMFETDVLEYQDNQHYFRDRPGKLTLPMDLAPWTRAVLGFEQQPVAVRRFTQGVLSAGLLPFQVASLYGVPRIEGGAGRCIGVIALGGGYLRSDLVEALRQSGYPAPNVIDQSVQGAVNSYTGGNEADEEIALDLQVVCGIVPRARVVVYFAPNSLAGLTAAITQAVYDNINRPEVLSISWGSAEQFWNGGARDALQAVLADAIRLNVSVIAAAGDALATCGLSDGLPHVWFPASSPYVLSCGGTRLKLDSESSRIEAEEVWNEGAVGTGGGISEVFPVPVYQQRFPLPASASSGRSGRGVPDVAAAAASVPGYRIFVGGQALVKDGTSAATPFWASILLLANGQRGSAVGFPNLFLYGNPAVTRIIATGNNRIGGVGYDATPVWNACTGLGAPIGAAVIDGLSRMA